MYRPIFSCLTDKANLTLRPTLCRRCVVAAWRGGLTADDGSYTNDRSDDNL
jgi:hypothetical protein